MTILDDDVPIPPRGCKPRGPDPVDYEPEQPELEGMDMPQNIAGGIVAVRPPWLFGVDARRVEWSHETSEHGAVILYTVELGQRWSILWGLFQWWAVSFCSCPKLDVLQVVARTFLRSGHRPARPVL